MKRFRINFKNNTNKDIISIKPNIAIIISIFITTSFGYLFKNFL